MGAKKLVFSKMKGKRSVFRRSKDGVLVEFDSLASASRAVNGNTPNLVRSLRGSGMYKGYHFKYNEIIIKDEIWIEHPTLEIECSDKGRVRPLKSGRAGVGTKNGDYLYYRISGKYHLVHRLIAETFIENTDDKPTVDHIDGNPRNNDMINLRWATHKEQMNNRKDNLPISPILDK